MTDWVWSSAELLGTNRNGVYGYQAVRTILEFVLYEMITHSVRLRRIRAGNFHVIGWSVITGLQAGVSRQRIEMQAI